MNKGLELEDGLWGNYTQGFAKSNAEWKIKLEDTKTKLWFKKIKFIHDKLACNCANVHPSKHTRMDDKRESSTDTDIPPNRDHPQKLVNDNMYIYNVENLECINKKSTTCLYAADFFHEADTAREQGRRTYYK